MWGGLVSFIDTYTGGNKFSNALGSAEDLAAQLIQRDHPRAADGMNRLEVVGSELRVSGQRLGLVLKLREERLRSLGLESKDSEKIKMLRPVR